MTVLSVVEGRFSFACLLDLILEYNLEVRV